MIARNRTRPPPGCSRPPATSWISSRGADPEAAADELVPAGAEAPVEEEAEDPVEVDEDEIAEQQAFMFGPPPLGPGAPPLERLQAYGHSRLRFVHTHQALLSDAARDPHTRYNSPATLHRSHIRMLLESAGTTGDLDAQTDALVALLDADRVAHEMTDRGKSLEQLAAGWDDVACKLCGT